MKQRIARVALPVVVVVAILGGSAAALDEPPMPPIGNVDTTTPPPGAPTTDVIGIAPPPPPSLGDAPPPALPDFFPDLPELPELPVIPSVACYAGGGQLTLRMSPAYAKITPTQAVTLSARLLQAGRACQAGLPVRFYTRGPGALAFQLSRTVATDGQGLVRTTYVRPRGDFRWYARSLTAAGSVQSAAGLVQVR